MHEILHEIPGRVILAFTEDYGKYYVVYNPQVDQGKGFHKSVGLLLKLMKENPELIDEVLQMVLYIVDNMYKPFNNILTMKNLRKPIIRVSATELSAIRDRLIMAIDLPLNKKNLQFLPKAYEDATGTMLVFPKKEVPETFRFRDKDWKWWQFWKKSIRRKTFNIMAYKMEDGSEIIKIRLK